MHPEGCLDQCVNTFRKSVGTPCRTPKPVKIYVLCMITYLFAAFVSVVLLFIHVQPTSQNSGGKV